MSRRVGLTAHATRLARKGRPWFFADDIAFDEGDGPGLVRLVDDAGRDLGLALCSPQSRLAVRRAGTWPGEGVPGIEPFFADRIAAALARRAELRGPKRGYRVVHGEADGVPGLVVDAYDDCLVVQVTSAALEPCAGELVAVLDGLLSPRSIVARNDVAVRRFEGLAEEVRLLHGRRVDEVWIEEDGVEHVVRLFGGHKTGFYLDQRPARAWVRRHAAGRRVLDLFAYQGAFALAALRGGAVSALCVDESDAALERARGAAEENGLGGLETRQGNVFDVLRELREGGGVGVAHPGFDLVVVDPPAFAKSRREVEGAVRGYRDLNRHALRVLAPGGLCVTCSCSHHVTLPRFEEVLRQAAADLPFRVLLRERLGAGMDHPAWVALPESEYLKVLVLERAG